MRRSNRLSHGGCDPRFASPVTRSPLSLIFSRPRVAAVSMRKDCERLQPQGGLRSADPPSAVGGCHLVKVVRYAGASSGSRGSGMQYAGATDLFHSRPVSLLERPGESVAVGAQAWPSRARNNRKRQETKIACRSVLSRNSQLAEIIIRRDTAGNDFNRMPRRCPRVLVEIRRAKTVWRPVEAQQASIHKLGIPQVVERIVIPKPTHVGLRIHVMDHSASRRGELS